MNFDESREEKGVKGKKEFILMIKSSDEEWIIEGLK